MIFQDVCHLLKIQNPSEDLSFEWLCKNKTKTTHGKQNKKTNKKVYNFEKIKKYTKWHQQSSTHRPEESL